MSGRWWRAYSRARHDPKLLKLSDKHFRWWFNLVSVAADNDGVLPPHADLAVEFRVSDKAMTEALDALIAARLFDHDETGIRPHNWNGLQYKSDVSTERVQRFRERHRNVSETPSESESDTEQKQIQTPAPAARAQLLTEEWEPGEAEVASLKAEIPWLVGELYDSRMRAFRDWCVANATRTFNPAATWRGFMRQTRKPHDGKPWSKPDAQALPAAEPWDARVAGFHKSGFWLPAWGPKPGEPGCYAPSGGRA